jgi:hypothetical protein
MRQNQNLTNQNFNSNDFTRDGAFSNEKSPVRCQESGVKIHDGGESG